VTGSRSHETEIVLIIERERSMKKNIEKRQKSILGEAEVIYEVRIFIVHRTTHELYRSLKKKGAISHGREY
jgi:hypothetical protein